MGQLRIYNTNKIQVYPEQGESSDDERIRDVVNNSIEYLVDTAVGRIIALVRADAPQVKGRDRANFYVEFEPDMPGDLPTQLVARLDRHESTTEWEFFKDEPRWSIPWTVTASELNAPGQLQYDVGRVLTIEELIRDNQPLDLGFRGHDDAASVISYYLAREVPNVTLAVASNGRKKVIQSAAMVLQPGSYEYFEPLNEPTKTRISNVLAELRSKAKTHYIDTSVRAVKSFEDAVEEEPIRALENIDGLHDYLGDGESEYTADAEMDSDAVRMVISRTETLRTGENPDSGPHCRVLAAQTRKQGIARIAGEIKDTRAAVSDRAEETALKKVEQDLNELAGRPVDDAHDAITTLENRILEGRFEPNTGDERVDDILVLHAKVESVDVEPFDEQSVLQAVYADIKERKDQIQERKLAEYIESIDAWKRNLPADGARQSRDIALSSERLESAFAELETVRHDSDSLSKPLDGYNDIVRRIRDGSVLDDQHRQKLPGHFDQRMQNYREEVVTARVENLKQECSELIQSKAESLTRRKEYEILGDIGYAINNDYPPRFDYYNDFRKLIRSAAGDSLLSQATDTKLKGFLINQLETRKKEVKEEFTDQMASRFGGYRDDFIERRTAQGGIQFAMDGLFSVSAYLDTSESRAGLSGIPSDYASALRQLKTGNYDILVKSDAQELRKKVKKDRSQRLGELRGEYKAELRSQLITSVGELEDLFSGEQRVKLLRKYEKALKGYLNPSGIPNPRPQSSEARDCITEFRTGVEKLHGDFEPEVGHGRQSTVDHDREYLDTEDRKELKREAKSTVSGLYRESQNDIIDRSVSESVNNIKRGLSGTEESVEGLRDAMDQMDDIVRYLESESTQANLPESTVEDFSILDSNIVTDSQKKRYRREMIQEVDEIVDGISNLQRKTFSEIIRQRLERIDTQYQSPSERIVRYHAIRMLLNEEPRHKLKFVPHEMVLKSKHLAEGVMRECRQNWRGHIGDLIERERVKMVPPIEERLGELEEDHGGFGKKLRVKVGDAGWRPRRIERLLRENSPVFIRYYQLTFRHGAISCDTYHATIERLKTVWINA